MSRNNAHKKKPNLVTQSKMSTQNRLFFYSAFSATMIKVNPSSEKGVPEKLP